MQRGVFGFTLLEVLIATLVVTVGLLALAGALTMSAGLAGQGRRSGRAALLLQSRADLLRQEILAARPRCIVPAAGSVLHAPGLVEAWTAEARPGGVALTIRVGPDTLVTRVACR